jgi:hypothetical protein
MRSVAQTKEECEDKPYTQRSHDVRPEGMAALIKRDANRAKRQKRMATFAGG